MDLPKKNIIILLESHISNMSLNDTWTMVLEALPAGSPINSLQTVNDNFVELEKKPEALSLKVSSNSGQLVNTMDMVADMKSQEVASRQHENEHKVRLHNLNQLDNFRDITFQERIELITAFLFKLLGNKQFDIELITLVQMPNSLNHWQSLPSADH